MGIHKILSLFRRAAYNRADEKEREHLGLVVLSDPGRILKAQRRFVRLLRAEPTKRVHIKVGFRGGSLWADVLWAKRLDIWFHSEEAIERKRHWNAFGVGEPPADKGRSIACEINFPIRGLSRRVGAVFAEDSQGNTCVLHRGRIGGGREGIGRSLFVSEYRGEWAVARDGDRENKFAMIGGLDSPLLPSQVAEFVKDVRRIKQEAKLGKPRAITTVPKGKPFTPEFVGKKRFKTPGEIEATCNHGLVVNRLQKLLEAAGYHVERDGRRDLFASRRKGRVDALFEVKSEGSPQSIYTAVGQLLLHGMDWPEAPRLILVVPERLAPSSIERLKKLGIEVLHYRLADKTVRFPDLANWKL